MPSPYDISEEKVRWVSLFRAIIALVSLVLLIYWQTKIETIGNIKDFLKILIFVFTLSLIYGGILTFIKRFFLLSIIQIIVDYFIVSFIIARTGGVDSPFIFFYVFPVIESGIFFGKNGAYPSTFLNLFFLGISFVLQYNKMYPYKEYFRYTYNKEELFYHYSIFSLGFLVLGLLIAYLNAETRKARESLKKSEDKYLDLEQLKSAIIQCIDSGLIIVIKPDKIYTINDLAKKILEKLSLKEEDILNLFSNEIRNIFEKNESVKIERRLKRRDQFFFIGASLVPLYDHNGDMIGSLINFSDITEKKVMEERLRIEDKFAFLGKLSTVIAHEIKNPLASIKGSINFVKENLDNKEDIDKLLNISSKELDRLNEVINDFLYYSRSSPLQLSKVYLKNLLEEIWFELTFSLTNKDKYCFNYEGEDIVFKGDPGQMRQVFLNLFLNSLDAMKEKGEGNIFVKTTQEDNHVIIEVEDDGGGIGEDHLGKVFDPFFSTKRNGTGLGLAIVYKIIEEHKGQIYVSNTERGAKFTIRLSI